MNGEKTPAKKKDVMTILAVIGLACLVLFAGNDPLIELTPGEVPPEEYIPVSANVELYKFDSLATNTSANIELWLLNIGDETATNISVFVRARNQNGTILFSENISLTALILRANETCSGAYMFSFDNTTSITYTIEISWDLGRNSYQRI
jgi:hypothetical protein